ncbi:MAG: UDP-N-acetylmuramate--L-alanine ligase [Actinomycetota bacterium]|nr:UDP-N-acetylmuramate--L-alanine ligase [Actinomycetota bacterium]
MRGQPAGAPVRAEDLGRVHLVGIGGAGMSGIARIMLARGIAVSGSDARESTALSALRALGATVSVGHAADQVGDADTVVVSTAIREANPELAEARRRGLRVLPRAAALAALMAGRRGVAVAGTHGKTTTTSMLTVALQHCGADPSFAIGGDLNDAGSNAHHGTGALFVAEADESDGSFLLLSPQAAIVTNVEADHLDFHGTVEAYVGAFEQFAAQLGADGFLVGCADDPGSVALVAHARARGVPAYTYGTAAAADLRLEQVSTRPSGTTYTAVLDRTPLGQVQLAVPGRHLALNSAAALLTGVRLGQPAELLREGLAAYTGVRRRFEFKGVAGGVRVFDDYAHHPTEVAAQLRTAREVAGGGRLIVAFQPHLYSRTQTFAREFGAALGLADEVVVMDVYGAREDPVPGVTGSLVAAHVPLPPARVQVQPSWSAVAGDVAGRARPGDLVVTMGAGDVTMIGPEVLDLLEQRTS